MKKRVILALLSMGLCGPLFVACQKHKDEVIPAEEIPAKEAEPPVPTVETPAATPGYFVISSIQRATAPGGRTTAGETIRFDLGALKASKEFLFMIANGGDEAIFDVTLTTDKPAFQIFPGKIQLVPGRKGSAIIPLLTVGVTHGVNLNGTGSALTLPRGENVATITMKGRTLSGKDTVSVEGKFVVAVDAKVIDAKILSGGSEVVPERNTSGYVSWTVELAKTVKLLNTGSVAIQATITHTRLVPIWEVITNVIEVQPDEAKDITELISKPNSQDMYAGMTGIKIKDEGIVYNINQFNLISK